MCRYHQLDLGYVREIVKQVIWAMLQLELDLICLDLDVYCIYIEWGLVDEAHLGTFQPTGPLGLWFIFPWASYRLFLQCFCVLLWKIWKVYYFIFFYPICWTYPGLHCLIYSFFFYVFNCSSSIKWAPTSSSNITGWVDTARKYGWCVYDIIVEHVSK